jgi:leukotriene-A4 hydrolase
MDTVTLDIMSKLDADLNLTMTVDPECKQRWYPLAIRKGYQSALEPAHEFISSQGRLKYLTPIYMALKQSG